MTAVGPASAEPGGQVVLGISADLHDAAACVVVDGEIAAAAEEERFTRTKHEAALPVHAAAWCLDHAGVGPGELSTVAFHDKPFTTYERILVTHARSGPRALPSLGPAVATWSRSKLWVRARIARFLQGLGHSDVPLLFAEHHVSHAAAAFLPSPFDDAAILTVDGVGEWATASIGVGRGGRVELLEELRFPDSVGLLYSTVTAHCGFAVNDGEYKLMGLAPYGTPRFADALRDQVVDIADDGSIGLDQQWFAYQAGRRMASRRLDELLDGPPRRADQPLSRREADLAASMQAVLEEILLAMAAHAHELTGLDALCMAGGVALNCVANDRILRDGPFDDLWVQPAAGDDGSAIGAALWAHHQVGGAPRTPLPDDAMRGCLLGPAYGQDEIEAWLRENGIEFTAHADDDALCDAVAGALADGAVVGWFRGRMEFGPRALGGRSILADPRGADVVARINARVKQREGFRPFAPAVLEEKMTDWFEIDRPSRYMLRTARVRPPREATDRPSDGPSDRAPEEPDAHDAPDFAAQLAAVRSDIPACTHVDHSARVQTVASGVHPALHQLLSAFDATTGCPVLLNTSFNGADEPIVRTPADAVRCAASIGLDLLVLERCVLTGETLAAVAAAVREAAA